MPWECVLSACGSAHARVCSWDLVHCVTLQGQFFQTYQVLINGNFLLINDTDLFFSFSFFLLFSLSFSLSISLSHSHAHSLHHTDRSNRRLWLESGPFASANQPINLGYYEFHRPIRTPPPFHLSLKGETEDMEANGRFRLFAGILLLCLHPGQAKQTAAAMMTSAASHSIQ